MPSSVVVAHCASTSVCAPHTRLTSIAPASSDAAIFFPPVPNPVLLPAFWRFSSSSPLLATHWKKSLESPISSSSLSLPFCPSLHRINSTASAFVEVCRSFFNFACRAQCAGFIPMIVDAQIAADSALCLFGPTGCLLCLLAYT